MTDPRAVAAPYEEISARLAGTMARIDEEFQAEKEDIEYFWEREEARVAPAEEEPRRPIGRVRQQADPSETGYYAAGWLT